MQTEDGTVWASTILGLAWYDGYRWNKMINSQGLPEKRATQICKGYSNTIYAIIDGNLYYGNTTSYKMISLPREYNCNIVSVASMNADSTIVSTDKIEYPYLLITKNSIKTISLDVTGRLFNTRNNNIFLGNAKGVFKINNLKSIKLLSDCFVRTITENKNNNTVMTVDAPHDMIGVWEWEKNTVPNLSHSEKLLPVRTLDISSKGTVIAIYETGEVHIKLNNSWKSLSPLPSPMISATFIKYDDMDNLWIGTDKGLFFYKDSSQKWIWRKHKFSDPKDIVMEIFKGKDGKLWVGSSNGITVYDINGKAQEITTINGVKLGLVTGINEDSENNIWISSGASFEGAFKWDGTKWQHYGFDQGLKCPRVHKIKKDRNGRLWFLGLGDNRGHQLVKNDPGAYMYDGEYFHRTDTTDGLLHNRVYAFAESYDGAKWFGNKYGLSKLKNGHWLSFDRRNIKNLNVIYSLEVDKENNVWFSNFTSQLGYIDSKDSIHWIWDWISSTDYRQKIWDIKVDERGILWIASTRGLFSYDHGNWSSYDYESDYKLRELRTVLPLNDNIYVGGHGIGVGILRRNQIGYSIKTTIVKPIIEPNIVHLRWHVDAYWGAMPSDEIEVRYRLNNDQWSDWKAVKEVTYEGLMDGTHNFEIQAKDIYGNIQKVINSVEFIVPPPAYKNPLYIAPFALLVIIIIILIYKNIQERILHAKNIQNQRIRISNDLHDDVGSNLGSISLMSQRIGRDRALALHLKEDVGLISDTAIQTAEELRDIVWYINPKNDTILSMDNRLRDIAYRQLRGMDLQFQMNDIVKSDVRLIGIRRTMLLMYKEILHNIIKHAKATKVMITIDHQPDTFTLSVHDNGVGFDHTEDYSGNGLKSLQLRADEAKARLTIESAKGSGTNVTVVFNDFTAI
ncbi:MAG: ATP-binding protein [Bacteroidota bacterium]